MWKSDFIYLKVKVNISLNTVGHFCNLKILFVEVWNKSKCIIFELTILGNFKSFQTKYSFKKNGQFILAILKNV